MTADDALVEAIRSALMSEDFVFVDGQGTYLDVMEAGQAAELLLPLVREAQAEAFQRAADQANELVGYELVDYNPYRDTGADNDQ